MMLRVGHGKVAREYSAQVQFRIPWSRGNGEEAGKCPKLLQKGYDRGKTVVELLP